MAFSGNSGNGLYAHHIRFKNAEVYGGATGVATSARSRRQGPPTRSNEMQNIVTIHGGGRTVGGGCGSGGFECQSYGVYMSWRTTTSSRTSIFTIHPRVGSFDSPQRRPASCNNVIRNSRIHDITRTGATPG